MKITKNKNGAWKVDGRTLDSYKLLVFLQANDLGRPSNATQEIINRFLAEKGDNAYR